MNARHVGERDISWKSNRGEVLKRSCGRLRWKVQVLLLLMMMGST